MSCELDKACRYEEKYSGMIAPAERPAYHLSSRVGWMNDPNGFSFYGGMVHLFYQYHPYDTIWGPMHWGHAVSRDLLTWEYLPCAMAPDMPYDRDGCFSGSALTLPDGRHLLMYTGIVREKAGFGMRRALQTQNLAIGDGLRYEKYGENPVLDGRSLPAGGSPYDFRDPKLYREADGTYSMIAANDNEKGGGQIIRFTSPDALHWTFDGTILKNDGRIGQMWECPDLFSLDGRDVLLLSAQDMLPEEFEYHNGNGTVCFIGTYDRGQGVFHPETDHAIDYGIDFYAPQTLLLADGRRVMIGWMQNWDTCNLHKAPSKWFGQMSLPRELSVKNGRLLQSPIREIEAHRRNRAVFNNVVVRDGEISLPGIEGRQAEIDLLVEPADEGQTFSKFAFRFAADGQYHTALSFRPHESILKIDRKFSGSRRAVIHQRRARVTHDKGRLHLRIFLDRMSAEVFVGDGEQTLSAVIYTDPSAKGMSFFADGAVRISVTKYDLMF